MLVATDIDRVRGIVSTFRFPDQPGVFVHRDSVDDAVQFAFERLARMFVTFEGTEMHSYRAAMRRCVNYACMDHCRKEMARERGISGSLDEEMVGRDGERRDRYEDEIAKKERERIDLAEELELAEELQERVDAAIESIDGDKGVVLQMTRDGCPTDDIADRLDTSRANVYKLRERGLKELRERLDGDGQP